MRIPQRLVRTVVVLVSTALVGAAPSLGGSNAAAGAKVSTSTVVNLTATSATVTSSRGTRLYVTVFTTRDLFAGQGESTTAQISVSADSGESHTWRIDVPNADFTHSPKNHGAVRVATKQFGKLGSIHLSYRPDGTSKTKTCRVSNTRTIQPVAVSGVVVLKTDSGWGRVGSPAKSLTFKGHSMVEIDRGPDAGDCQGGGGSTPESCQGDVSWATPNIDGDGDGPGKRPNINYVWTQNAGSTDVELDTFDFATIAQPALSKTAAGAEKLVIRAGRHGLFTGSATLTTTGSPTLKKNSKCQGSSRSWSATYTPGSRPLTVHDVVGGTVVQRSAKDGYLSIDPSH